MQHPAGVIAKVTVLGLHTRSKCSTQQWSSASPKGNWPMLQHRESRVRVLPQSRTIPREWGEKYKTAHSQGDPGVPLPTDDQQQLQRRT